MAKRNRELGQDGEITRRDFLDGVALVIGGTVASTAVGSTRADAAETVVPGAASPAASGLPGAGGGAASDPANYPPMRTGMRGFRRREMNAGHAVRDGRAFAAPVDTGEVYDLVVVGAGMAGLGAAYFYRKQIPRQKVLVLDGCDDFGGHARRNEFFVDGKRLIAGGGTAALWRPNTFPPEAQELLRDIGIDREHFYKQENATPNPVRDLGLRPAMFFSKESYGEDRLIPNTPPEIGMRGGGSTPEADLRKFFAQAPFSEGLKQGLLKLLTDKSDHMPGVPVQEKVKQLKKMSYTDFLTKVAKIHPEAVKYVLGLGSGGSSNQGAGPDTYSAWYAWRRGQPGFAGMALPEASQISNMVKDPGGISGSLTTPPTAHGSWSGG